MKKLETALQNSVSDSLSSKGKAAILFSGGLDSTVLAFLAKKSGADPLLICAGADGSEDVRFAREIAKELGMRLKVRVIQAEELPALYRSAMEISGERGFMKAELGMLFLSCCEAAESEGVCLLVSGTGAEELFLGYGAHAQMHARREGLDAIRRRELSSLREKDIMRAERIAAHFGMRVSLPYLAEEVVRAALSIPAAENFRNGENKSVLRSLARKIGVPARACSRPKRAMQYGAGTHGRLLALRKRGEF